MSITVTIRDVYGRQSVYPVCETAKRLAELAGTKTFTPAALRLIRDLGYAVQTEQRAAV